ncbi:hypothetical protein BH20ACT2_BH20ACT2_19270 [soil metagenome]
MRGPKVALVVVVALTLQLALVSDLRVAGASGDLLLLVAVAGGIAGGSQHGAIIGFAAGLTFDLFLQTPFGLSALAYCLAGYLVGTMQSTVLRAAWWIPVASAIGGSVLGVGLFVVVGEVVGQDDLVSSELPTIVAVVSVLNALLCLPAIRAVRWALADDSRDRMLVRR